MKKRMLAWIMTMCMVLSLLPVTAGAAGTVTARTDTYEFEWNYVTQSWQQSGNYGIKDVLEEQDIIQTEIERGSVSVNQTMIVPKKDDQICIEVTDGETTWTCVGYQVYYVLSNSSTVTDVHEWTPEELKTGSSALTLKSDGIRQANIYYMWVPDGRGKDDTENDETVNITFHFLDHVLLDDGQSVYNPFDVPSSCDFSEAEAELFVSTTSKSKREEIRDAINDGTITPIAETEAFQSYYNDDDGTITIQWPKGYRIMLEDDLELVLGKYYYYVKVTCGDAYEWYRSVTLSSWKEQADGTQGSLVGSAKPEEDADFYACLSNSYRGPIAAEGYSAVRAYLTSTLEDQSDWSEEEFNEIQYSEITYPGWNFPSMEEIFVPTNWEVTLSAPATGSTMGENGEVYLNYTDGSFQWQCIGVQYEDADGTNYFTPHTDWRDSCNIAIDTSEVGTNLFIYYVWKEIKWGKPPEMYTIEYDINLEGLEAIGFDPDNMTRIDGIKYDDQVNRYHISANHDFSVTWKELDRYISGLVNETNSPVREQTEFTIGQYPSYGTSTSEKYYDFLVQDETNNRYFQFDGWLGEDGELYEYGQTAQATQDLAGEDTTITFKVNWKEIPALTETELPEIESVLPLDVFYAGDGVGQNVLITQKTSTDENLDGNKRQTGNPVTLGKDETIEYQVSACVNGSLTGIGGSQGQNYNSDFAAFQFYLNVDENLEFADVAEDGSVTITFSAEPDSRYEYAPVTLEETNIPNETITKTDEGLYTITFDPQNVPKNDDGSMKIVLTLQWNGDGWGGSMGVENTDSTASMTLKDLVFKVKEEALSASGGFPRIESSANVTAQITMKAKTGNAREYYETASNLLTSSRWGWEDYFIGDPADEKGEIEYAHALPTAYAKALQFMNYKLKDYNLAEDELCALDANTVVATIVESEPITVKPADMTIYEGGDGGYDAVVGENGEVVETGSSSLPHPIFEVTAEGVNLVGMTFTNADSGSAWTLTQLNGTDYYRFAPTTTGGTEVRVQYSDGETVVTEDEFTPETDVFRQYTISIYDGGTSGEVIATSADGKKNYLVETGTGTLTVRAVEKETGATSDIVAVTPAEDGSVTYTEPVSAGSAVAVAPADTTYTLNDTDVALPTDGTAKPSLLFDDIIESDGKPRVDALEDAVDTALGTTDGIRHYEAKYLDLVDANNGNAWISSSEGTDIYWGYPTGTNKNTNFTLVHFKDLHRDGTESGFDIEDINSDNVDVLKTGVELTNTDYGIKFHVGAGGFSPFVLVWEVKETSTDPGTTPGGGNHDSDYTLYYHSNFGDDKTFYQSDDERTMEVRDYADMSRLPDREGYEFVGWNTEEDGSGDDYAPGDEFRMTERRAHLYAMWERVLPDPDDTGVSRWLNTDDHGAYLSGYPDNTFGPDRSMTRAEVAQMFYALLLDKDVPITVTFSDVPADAWYAEAVNTLASLGMVEGYADGTFRPDNTITRAEFVTIAVGFADLEIDGEARFTDVARNAWYYPYIADACAYGWIGGYPDGSFRPDNTITRAEVTVIVNNMLGRAADESYVDRHEDELRQFGDLTEAHWAWYPIAEAVNSHDYTGSGANERWR